MFKSAESKNVIAATNKPYLLEMLEDMQIRFAFSNVHWIEIFQNFKTQYGNKTSDDESLFPQTCCVRESASKIPWKKENSISTVLLHLICWLTGYSLQRQPAQRGTVLVEEKNSTYYYKHEKIYKIVIKFGVLCTRYGAFPYDGINIE